MKKCECDQAPERFRHTLTVERPGTTTDDDGQIDLTDDDNWTAAFRIKANFITKGGGESRVFRQVQAVTDTVIKTPATANTATIDPSWRIKWGSRVFNIVAAYRIDEDTKVFQIEATERRQP